MFKFLWELPESVKTYIWLAIISLVGGFVGFITKNSHKLKDKSFIQKVGIHFTAIISSMFISYIVFQLLYCTTLKQGLSVAVAGIAAYMGTDVLVILQDKLMEKLKSKIDKL